MRHRKKFNHLGRKSSHRKAMLANMAASLILHKRIETTVAKAKALRMYVEPIITKSKEDSTHSRRVVFSYLKNKYAVSELFREVATKVANREGGYTRILKTGTRLGDSAEMCFIELVDYNENMLVEKDAKAKKSRRSRRKKSSSTTEAQTTAKVEEKQEVVEEVKEETPEEVKELKEEVQEEVVEQVKDKVKEEVEDVVEVAEPEVKEEKEEVDETDKKEEVKDETEKEKKEEEKDENKAEDKKEDK
jgi:large subunit ribosomal protein L17